MFSFISVWVFLLIKFENVVYGEFINYFGIFLYINSSLIFWVFDAPSCVILCWRYRCNVRWWCLLVCGSLNVSVFSVMWLELLMTLEITVPLWSSMYRYQSVKFVNMESCVWVMCCKQFVTSVFLHSKLMLHLVGGVACLCESCLYWCCVSVSVWY